MNANYEAIKAQLELRPGHVMVTPNGEELYALHEDGTLCVFLGENLHLKNEAEINEWFQETIAKIV